MDNKIIIGLPAYNEEKSIGKLLQRIISLHEEVKDGLEVVIVNDGSKDKTEEILKEYSTKYPFIKYINHSKNSGLGKAIETLLTHAIENYSENDTLVTLDADNTHNPNIIPNMVQMLKVHKLDLVIASRFTGGGKEVGLSAFRKVLSRGASLFCKYAFPIKNVRDYSCGFRAYSIGYLKKLMGQYGGSVVRSNGFECMVEILARSSKVGVRAGEYPLVLEYNLKESPSKMKVSRTILGYLRLKLTIRKPRKRSYR